jgi:hypothetical protein
MPTGHTVKFSAPVQARSRFHDSDHDVCRFLPGLYELRTNAFAGYARRACGGRTGYDPSGYLKLQSNFLGM